MSVSPLPEFSSYAPARLLEARPAAAQQVRLRVDPPPSFGDRHRHAGQFCRMRAGDAEGIFAMASAPGVTPIEFLVRTGAGDGGEAADRLAAMSGGTPIEMSGPAGDGFGFEYEALEDLVFVATGTGVAPVCAALDALLNAGSPRRSVSLIYGVRSEAHVAIHDDLARWAATGVGTRLCFSQVEGGVLRGERVQDVLRATHPDLSQTSVVAVGQPEMLSSLLDVVRELGGTEDRFFTNL